MDLNSVAQAQGLSLSDAAVSKLRGGIMAEYDQQQRVALGDAGFEELRTYERTSGVRKIARNLAALATVQDAPFSPLQLEQLVGVFANASAAYRNGGGASASNVDWDAALTEAAAVLSPRQLELIRTIEPDGGGILHARWSAELTKAAREESKTPRPNG